MVSSVVCCSPLSENEDNLCNSPWCRILTWLSSYLHLSPSASSSSPQSSVSRRQLRLVQIIVIILPGNVFVMAAILIDRHLQSVANYLILSLGNFQLFQRMGWFVKYMTGFRWFRHTFFLCVIIWHFTTYCDKFPLPVTDHLHSWRIIPLIPNNLHSSYGCFHSFQHWRTSL